MCDEDQPGKLGLGADPIDRSSNRPFCSFVQQAFIEPGQLEMAICGGGGGGQVSSMRVNTMKINKAGQERGAWKSGGNSFGKIDT